MSVERLQPARLTKAKRAFTTRRVPARHMRTIVSGEITPAAGDLVLATIHELGKHRKIERVNGRRALLLPGDEVIVCYGNRYAPDQFEALIGDDLGPCQLVAGGGIASREINRHSRMIPATEILPVGLIGDEDGKPLNVINFRLKFRGTAVRKTKVILVAGTAMNSGKTLTAASVVCGLSRSGYRVAGIKATGTGSGGDMWKMKDMGAAITMDFTDAGFPSTYKAPDAAIEEGVLGLINHAEWRNCHFAVVEVADGLQHQETAALLRSERLRSMVFGMVFAAYDSMGARAGYETLCGLGYDVLAISGQLTRSPLAMREAAAACPCPIPTPFEIQAGALVPAMTGQTEPGALEADADRIRRMIANPNNFVDDDVSLEEDRELVAVRTQDVEGIYSLGFARNPYVAR